MSSQQGTESEWILRLRQEHSKDPKYAKLLTKTANSENFSKQGATSTTLRGSGSKIGWLPPLSQPRTPEDKSWPLVSVLKVCSHATCPSPFTNIYSCSLKKQRKA